MGNEAARAAWTALGWLGYEVIRCGCLSLSRLAQHLWIPASLSAHAALVKQIHSPHLCLQQEAGEHDCDP
jgi:hypothetical protein